jgi:protein ImuA
MNIGHPMNAVPVTETLDHLRRTLAQIDPAYRSVNAFGPSLSLRVAAVDDALGGGLALGALHELAPALPAHGGAAAGFALALAALARTPNRQVLWIQSAFARTEAGAPYGLGLDCFGLPMDRVLVLVVARGSDVLWAMEEALKCRAVMAVIAEFTDDKHSTDLTALRRLSLAARAGGGLGLLLRHRTSAAPSAAVTRWEVASALSLRDRFGGLGRTTFSLSLTKNRYGPCGQWVLPWDHHACVFLPAALSLGVAETACERSDRTPFRRTG